MRIGSFLLVWMLSLAGLLPAQGGLHPQDGPDVDLRVRVSDERVRVSVQLNLAFIDRIVSVPREEDEYVVGPELDAIAAALREHYAAQQLVVADGIAITPQISGFALEEGEEEVAINFPKEGLKALTKVSFQLDHPVKSPPKRVAFSWHDYPPDDAIAFPWMKPEDIPPLSVVAELVAGAKSELISLATDEPEHTWHRPAEGLTRALLAVPAAAPPPNPVRLPLLSIALVLVAVAMLAFAAFASSASSGVRRTVLVVALLGCAPTAAFTTEQLVYDLQLKGTDTLPTEVEALEVFRPLHANIYAAFDHDVDSAIYDALAQSVAGPLLEGLYDNIYRGLILEEAGNAVARVAWVRIREAAVESIGKLGEEAKTAFVVRCRWRVHGSVFHFRHTHERTSEYLARYTVEATDQGWRITGHQALEQLRVQPGEEDEGVDGR